MGPNWNACSLQGTLTHITESTLHHAVKNRTQNSLPTRGSIKDLMIQRPDENFY